MASGGDSGAQEARTEAKAKRSASVSKVLENPPPRRLPTTATVDCLAF